jgi:2-hydroxy-6-oxonona-2,4-dienedioate hydrolase
MQELWGDAMNRRAALTLLGLGSVAALSGAVIRQRFVAAMESATAPTLQGSQTLATRFGTMEYAEAGTGIPVLMLHGTGGGFDQGLAFAAPLSRAGFRVIAPSRFGYLRSDFPDDPSSENQADALVDLLDALGLDRVPVLGGSAGTLSAIAFAIRHPDRCAALLPIVPATFVPGRPPVRPSPLGAAIMEYALGSDFLFWAGMSLAEDQMIATLLATDPALVHAAPPDEQARVRAILHGILPVSARKRGLLNDGLLAGTPQPMALEQIRAPTLTISVEDDRFGTAAAARHIAASVEGAKLVIYPSGGHVWVGHDAELWATVAEFLRGL